MKNIAQFLKFIFVGIVNTAVDLGVFNFLIFLFGAATGVLYIFFKTFSFFCAIINSYVMNKSFVFGSREDTFKKREFSLFLAVSLMGVLLNVSVAFLIYTLIYMYGNALPYYVAANSGAVAGSVMVLLWNFFGYKFFVFKDDSKK